MSVFAAIILGLIQGLTEFLPISSSGHLTLAEAILGIHNGNNYFNILLHLATLLSVLIVLYKDVLVLIKKPFSKLSLKVVLATSITCVGAAALNIFIPKLFEVGFLGFGFLLSGMLMLVCFLPQKKATIKTQKEISLKGAISMGISGCFAVLPGVSRSGTSICAGVLAGESKENSVKFSFLISIPIIIASMIFELVFGGTTSATIIGFWPCFAGAVSAFLSSFVSIKFMLKLAKKGNWIYFAIYLIVLSFAVLIYTFAF